MDWSLELMRLCAGGALAAIGLALALGGVIGVLRFPDVYTRLHAAATESIGVAIVLLGLAMLAQSWDVAARLLLLAGLVAFMGAARSQIVGNAAHTGGLAPLAGCYKAPRPGARQGRGRP
ncbi:MAG: monovalent cation/H(+) antiporter subunit G [Terricaulis sp.]